MNSKEKNERSRRALVLRRQGMTYREIGQELGLSGSRAADLVHLAERLERWQEYEKLYPRPPDPRKWHEGLSPKTVFLLERCKIRSKSDCAILAQDLPFFRGMACLPGWESDKEQGLLQTTRLPLGVVNEVRAWLGIPPLERIKKPPSAAEISRCVRLLEAAGFTVTAPKSATRTQAPDATEE